MLLPFTAVKAQFDAGDSTVCYNIMTNNFTANNLLNWNDPNPGNWLGVVWNTATPQRIIQLELKGDGSVNVGNTQGAYWPINMDTVSRKYDGFVGSGVNSMLLGNIDFSGLTELIGLDVRENDSISGINVSGLANLNHFFMSRNDIVDSLDLSNLPNLITFHAPRLDSLSFVDLSNCPRLRRVKLQSWSNGKLSYFNVTGSDSLIHLNLGTGGIASALSAIDLTGKTELRKFKAARYAIQTITGLSTCSKLFALCIADNDLSGSIDLTDLDEANMYKFNIRNDNGGTNHVDSVLNWASLTAGDIEVIGVADNKLTLSNATQMFNELTVTNNYYGDNQTRYGGDTIFAGGATSYPGEALIDINGVNVASTFTLFDYTGTQVGDTNLTGVFTFPLITDTGEYYVEMTNPGAAPASNSVLLTTNNFFVALPILTGSVTSTICATGSIVVNGNTYNATTPTGTEIFTSVGPFNLDSTVTINLTVLPVLTGNDNSTICATGSVVINGNTYNAATPTGTEVFTVGLNNCDSTVTIALNVLPVLTGNNNAIICATGSVVINGNTYNAATPTGTEVFTVGPNNCDSTVTIALNVLPALTGSVTNTVCATESIVVNGNTYDAATPTGTEVFTVGPNNCDSTVTINLTVLAPIDISTTTSNNTIASNATGVTYQWLDCSNNNDSIIGETGQNFTATINGDYAVVVTVGNCSETSACVNIATVGINELNNGNTVSVYPNPTTGSVSLNFGEALNAGSVIITDITGKQVYVLENLNTQILNIDVNHFSNGVYFVEIQNNNQHKVIKFIKQ